MSLTSADAQRDSLARYCGPSFGAEIIAEIDRIGVHPFILIRSLEPHDAEGRFVVCQTQNEAPEFIRELATLPWFAQSSLLRAFVRALQLDVYEAADLLFSWTNNPNAGVSETAQIGLPDGIRKPWFYGYPVFEIRRCESVLNTPAQRITTLMEAFEAYDTTQGNDALRFAIIEVLAFGLCRSLGSFGRCQEAEVFLDRALSHVPNSMHLKAAKHALSLELSGKEVPGRLAKFIGDDSGYLKQFICPHPFEHFEINHTGEVLVCAGPWLPTSIGQFLTDPVEGIINSAKAQEIRKSVVDGSYKYCNHLECARMIQGTLPKREDVEKTRIGDAMARPDHRVDGVEVLIYAFDKSCNLSCPSCRRELITEKASTSIEKVRAVEEKLPLLLPTLRVLEINASGELFASKSSRKVLELIDDERCPNLKLEIISNGTLFSENEWNKFPTIHDKIWSVRISTDAACKATFEKLRRPAKYESFMENIRFLRGLRARGTIPELKFSFTYQLDNFREMREFIDFCDEMNADFVLFERLLNIAFSHQEYRQKAVHYPDHPRHEEFLKIIRDPIFRTWRVWHDFDYPGVENLPAQEARRRIEWRDPRHPQSAHPIDEPCNRAR